MSLMEGVIVVDELARSDNLLIAGWVSYDMVGMVFVIPSGVVLTRGLGVS